MKRLLSVILSLVLVVSVFTMTVGAEEVKLISAKSEITFSDVDKDTTAGKAIYKLANAGILVGDGDGTFRPEAPIRRSELCKIVNTIFGYTEKDTTGFSDVTPSNWYYDHVLIAKKAGYIVGYDDGTFKGENYVTREQSCAILCRVANLVDIAQNVEIKDAVSEWAMPYVQKVLGNKLMSLEAGNTFRAQENIKRDEYSVVYANFVQEKPAETDKPSTDDKPSGGDRPSGGSPGGSTGGGNGGTGGNGGNTKPDEPEIDYEAVNFEILKNLRIISQDITDNMNVFTTEPSALMMEKINQCIQLVIADGSSNVIDRGHIGRKYGEDYVNPAKGYFAQIKADPTLKATFQDEVANLKVATIEWLLNAFEIDASELL
ncbi:MAG: S-layer homology domain-containing protein [Clostridia bacterium]|nr:S-layer homology domain-containing protein [Clostridia bacterium]